MRRWLAMIVLLTALVSFGPRPATSHEDICFGMGSIDTQSRYYYPTVGPTGSGAFAMTVIVGGCFFDGVHVVTGALTGDCLVMTGTGTTPSGHTMNILIVGDTMTISGHAIGGGTVATDWFGGDSCMTGADTFIVTFTHFSLHSGGTPPPNSPPNTPSLVAPADGATFATTDVPVFTVNAVDPNGDSYVATIEVQKVGSPAAQVVTTAPASSGSNASTTTGNLSPGTYGWRARARDFAAFSGWSGYNTFTVTLT